MENLEYDNNGNFVEEFGEFEFSLEDYPLRENDLEFGGTSENIDFLLEPDEKDQAFVENPPGSTFSLKLLHKDEGFTEGIP